MVTTLHHITFHPRVAWLVYVYICDKTTCLDVAYMHVVYHNLTHVINANARVRMQMPNLDDPGRAESG